MRPLAAFAVPVLLIGLTACGGGDEPDGAASPSPSATSPSYDAAEQRKLDATANLTDFFAVYAPLGEGEYFSRDEAGCIAEEVVEEPGLRRLQRAGVLNDELQYVIDAEPRFSRADAEDVTEAVFDCSDAAELLRRQVVADLDVTPAQRRCAADALDDDLLGDLFTLSLQRKPLDPALQRTASAFEACRDA